MRARLALALALLGPLAACAASPPAAGPPAAYTVRCRVHVLPLATAEALGFKADEREPVVSCSGEIDGAFERRVEVALAGVPGAATYDWPAVRVLHDAWTVVSPPAGPTASASTGLQLSVAVLPREAEWAPVALDVALEWSDADGARLARLPSSAQPYPRAGCVRVACLPPRSRAGELRARIAILHVVPVPD